MIVSTALCKVKCIKRLLLLVVVVEILLADILVCRFPSLEAGTKITCQGH